MEGGTLMRVIIIGAGKVGTFIAGDLTAAGHEVVVVERTQQRVDQLRQRADLDHVDWVVADACEVSQLAHASPQTADVFVAVTGDDEDNLVSSLLAKQEFGVPRVLARVNHPANEWLFTSDWGVDRAVSAPHLLSGLVQEAVTVGSVVRLLDLAENARLVEVTLSGDAPVVGAQISEVDFPREASVVAILRSRAVVVPRGDTSFLAGDEVLVLVTDESEPAVRRLLVAPSGNS
jgi:trk system potassium uptake protein TrkA